jgi:hypothetical protein
MIAPTQTTFTLPNTFAVAMWVNPDANNDGQSVTGKHTDGGGNIFLIGLFQGVIDGRIR